MWHSLLVFLNRQCWSVFCLTALFLIASRAQAQLSDPSVAAEAPIPGSAHSYIGLGAETVNPADGSLSFDLPLTPPAGRQLSMTFGVRYSATDQFHLVSLGNGILHWYNNLVTPYEVAGWSYQLPTYTGQVYEHFAGTVPPNNNPYYCDLTENYLFTGLDGVRRNLAAGSQWLDPSNTQGTCSTFPNNGSLSSNLHGWTLTSPTYTPPGYPPLTVADPSGTTYQFPGWFGISTAPGFGNSDGPPVAWGLLAQTITDRNGNQISLKNSEVVNGGAISYAGNSYVDTLGRSVVAWSGLGNNGDTLTISGLNNITLHWGTATVHFPEAGHVQSGRSDCSLTPNSTSPATIKFLTEIDLPNGQKYTFTSDSTNFGRIGKITFPDGGYVRYVWALHTSSAIVNLVCSTSLGSQHENWIFDEPAITDRYVSYDGSTEVLHQHFGYGITFSTGAWATKTTTMTSTDFSQSTITKYNYIPMAPDFGPNDISAWNYPQSPVEQTVQYQDGAGTTLRTVNKTWKNTFVENGDQMVLDNGQGRTKLYCYDGNEQVTHLYEYGFQSEGSYPGDPSCVSSSGLNTTARGPLKRQTTNVYQSFTPHIVEAPASVTVADGSGKTAKQTLYTYDESSLQSSGAIDLTNPGSQRANATTIQQLISSSTYATTKYAYFDTGQIASIIDPCGNAVCSDVTGTNHTTSYAYADNYATGSGTPPGNTNAFVTTITYPTVNGVTQHKYFQYAYSDGQLTQSQDENQKTAGLFTSYAYNDSLRRLTETDYPDGGQTFTAYNDTVLSPTVTTCSNINGTASATCSAVNLPTGWLVNLATMDGMGQVVQTQLTSDPEGPDSTDTSYDGTGRVYTQSNPHRSVTSTTDGTTTYTYDALGRTTNVSEPDGSSVATVYSGNQTTVTDEAGNQRTSVTDGLGRLVQVLEDPGSSPHLNYETDYTYDALNDLLSVTQKGGTTTSSQWRSRTFTYDSLSRLVCAANPEIKIVSCPTSAPFPFGTVAYTYDANGNLASKTAPSPNQPSTGTATVTTTYAYDALNRIAGKTYADTYANPATSPVLYGYDGKAITGCPADTPPSNTDTYPKGRRTSMCDGAEAATWTHDSMGRVRQETRSIASVIGQHDNDTYNLDGSVATTTSLGYAVQYSYSGAGRPIYLVGTNIYVQNNSATYAPFGGLTSAKLGQQPITITNAYNNRLQPLLISAAGTSTIISLCYDFHMVKVPSPNTACSLAAGSGDNGERIPDCEQPGQ